MRTSKIFEAIYDLAAATKKVTPSGAASAYQSHLKGPQWARRVPLSRTIRRIPKVVTKKSFYIPFGLGAGAIGLAQGFVGTAMQDPNTYAVMQQQLAVNDYARSYNEPEYRLGRPLGYPEQYYNYNLNPSDPLGATGALALAAFTTRHGR